MGVVCTVGGTFLLLLVLTVVGLNTLSSIRGYVLGEGVWSKAQKRGVLALHRYARGGDESDWSAFEAEIGVTLGDRAAREELEKTDPDMEVVRDGFTRGGVPEPFHEGMADLFRRFGWVPWFAEAVDIWRQGDREIDLLRGFADSLRAQVSAPDPDQDAVGALLAAIDDVDSRLTILESAFTQALNDAAFRVERGLLGVLIGIAVIVVFSAVGSGRYFYRQVQTREATLERSEARYRTLFEKSVVGTIVTRPEGEVIQVNRAFANMLGYDDPNELHGMMAQDLYVREEDREAIVGRLRHEGIVLLDELLIRRKDGEPVWLMTSSALFRDPESGAERILATCLDITERKELETRVARKGRMEAMGQLAGGIAHDFNNLLTAIQGNALLLAEKYDEEGGPQIARQRSDAREVVSEIVVSSRTAAELTEQLLAFSRGDPTQPSIVDLAGLVRRTQGLLERLLPENIVLETELTEDGATVAAPPAQLEQVVLNLVINARDAMPDGGRLHISVTRYEIDAQARPVYSELAPGPYVKLRVSDDGAGISPEARPRLFEPFFTTKMSSGGTGMGLATVYGIVTRAGGAIDVQTEIGEGSIFEVVLPHARSGKQRLLDAPPGAPDRAVDGTTILLVEDDDQVRDVTGRILRSGGFRLIEAARPSEALSKVEAGAEFDLLLTDVVMPDMSGPELARLILAKRPHVPVLFVSGYAASDLDGPALAGARTASLPKPFEPRTLLASVRQLLGNSSKNV